MATHVCKECKKSFDVATRGRPPSKCPACKGSTPANNEQPKPRVFGSAAGAIAIGADFDKEMAIVDLSPSTLTPDEIAGTIATHEPAVPEKKRVRSWIPSSEIPYQVLVTNMGWAYEGDNRKDAEALYEKFVRKSINGYGQVGRERVSLYNAGEVLQEFDPRKELV